MKSWRQYVSLVVGYLLGTTILAVFLPSPKTAVVPPCSADRLVTAIVQIERPKMGELERAFWVRAVTAAAGDAGVSPVVFAAQVAQESGFRGRAVSTHGAKGAAQIMSVWLKKHPGVDLLEIEANLHVGAKILAQYMTECGGLEGGLRCYAAGPKNQKAAQWYANGVLARVATAVLGQCSIPGLTGESRDH